jgi:hypothetical protein
VRFLVSMKYGMGGSERIQVDRSEAESKSHVQSTLTQECAACTSGRADVAKRHWTVVQSCDESHKRLTEAEEPRQRVL